MRVLREWMHRIGATLRPNRRDDHLAEELRLHMELSSYATLFYAHLRAGDLLVAYTDGVTEARNADGEEFEEDRLKAFLRAAVGTPVEEIASTLTDRIREWIAAEEQYDDVMFVIAAVK